MKTTLKLVAVALVVFGMSSAANAFTVDFLLEQLPGDTWTLKAKTDAPGGIAAFAVDLDGVATATSVAPRGTLGVVAFNGFTQGNLGSSDGGWASQAFAGQNTSAAGSQVYGLGFEDVAEADFAPAPTVMGSGLRDAGGYITLYTGTGLATYRSAQPGAWGAVWATPNPTPITPIAPGPELTGTYEFVPIPEPSAFVLAGLAIPALAYALRRRKAA